jgi:hypothetical protein
MALFLVFLVASFRLGDMFFPGERIQHHSHAYIDLDAVPNMASAVPAALTRAYEEHRREIRDLYGKRDIDIFFHDVTMAHAVTGIVRLTDAEALDARTCAAMVVY